jgi:RNA polymerase sigma-70 factor (ECF subfamily)
MDDRYGRQLIKRIRKGDREAFDQLVIECQGMVYGCAIRMLQDHDQALDVTQEVFLKVWTHIDSLTKVKRLHGWLYRVATNACLDRLRERKRFRVRTSCDDVILIPDWRPQADPRLLLQKAQWKASVEKAIDELPPVQKTVFVLKHFEQLKLQDIADILDSPLGTVKANLHHAVVKLRNRLGAQLEGSSRSNQGEHPRSEGEK